MRKEIFRFANLLLACMMLLGCDSCEEPSVEINYELVCSKDLLEYATPQVTYTSNNGSPVVFTIGENEWTRASNTSKSVIVINGDTVSNSSKGELLKWTKRVSYDDFTVVEDEMTVTYLPNNNAQGKTAHGDNFYHTLSATLDITDEDGNRYVPAYVSLGTTVLIGPEVSLSELISNYKDHRGFHVESNGKYSEK